MFGDRSCQSPLPSRPGRAWCHRTRSRPLFHGRQVGLTEYPAAAARRRPWCRGPHPPAARFPPTPRGPARGYSSDPTMSRAPQRPVPRGLDRGGGVRGGGVTNMLPLRPALRPPRRSSGDVVLLGRCLSVRGARSSARRREGPRPPPRGSSSPNAVEPHVHRPRRRAPCQVRGRSLRAIRRGDDVSPLPPAAARPHPARDLPCESRFRLRE